MNNLTIRLSKKIDLKFLPLALGGLTVAMVVAWILSGYFGYDVHVLISYFSSDHPGNILVGDRAFGVHTFSDYLLAHEYATAGNPWVNSLVPANNYPPLPMALFWIFSLLPYKIGLVTYLLLAFCSMIYPIIRELSRTKTFNEYGAVLVPCILSVGVIAALDRGNYVAFLVTPLYLFIKAIREEKWGSSALLLGLMVALKIYPAVLLVVYLRKRKILPILLVALYSVGSSIVAAYAFPGDVKTTLKTMSSAVFGFGGDGTFGLNPYNVSLFSAISRILSRIPSLSEELQTFTNHQWYIGIFYMALVAFVVIAQRIPFVISMFLLVSTLWLVPPLNFHYVSSLLLAPLAIAIGNSRGSKKPLSDTHSYSILYSLTTISILLTLLPIVIPMSHGPENAMRTIPSLCWLVLAIFATSWSLVPASRPERIQRV
ncbi:MAG: glycosyltransferase family 87 protein [Candidatus Nanopelagicaceae bacterium]|nr:glycosyltransferase family 87 protein [Candidatus Nanopelagicaceae bacterium]